MSMAASTTFQSGEGVCCLAHDINNNLAVILGQCELIAGRDVQPECAQRLGVITEMVKRIAQTINSHHCPSYAGRNR